MEKFRRLVIEAGACKVNNLEVPFAFHYPPNRLGLQNFLSELEEIKIQDGTNKVFRYTHINALEKLKFTNFWDLSLDGKLLKITSLGKESTFHSITFAKQIY